MRAFPTAVSASLARVSALCVAVFALGVGVLALEAAPAAHAEVHSVAVQTDQAPAWPVRAQDGSGGPDADLTAGSTTNPAPPSGPRIEPEESEQATEDKAQQKAIIGAVAAGLLVIVILGRRQRNKNKPGGQG